MYIYIYINYIHVCVCVYVNACFVVVSDVGAILFERCSHIMFVEFLAVLDAMHQSRWQRNAKISQNSFPFPPAVRCRESGNLGYYGY